MGFWGTNLLENDTALDFVADMEDATRLARAEWNTDAGRKALESNVGAFIEAAHKNCEGVHRGVCYQVMANAFMDAGAQLPEHMKEAGIRAALNEDMVDWVDKYKEKRRDVLQDFANRLKAYSNISNARFWHTPKPNPFAAAMYAAQQQSRPEDIAKIKSVMLGVAEWGDVDPKSMMGDMLQKIAGDTNIIVRQNYDGSYQAAYDVDVTPEPTLDESIARMKAEVIALVKDGRIPSSVSSFYELHDYIDANCLGGFCEEMLVDSLITKFGGRDENEGYPDALMLHLSSAQDAIHKWIESGKMRVALSEDDDSCFTGRIGRSSDGAARESKILTEIESSEMKP